MGVQGSTFSMLIDTYRSIFYKKIEMDSEEEWANDEGSDEEMTPANSWEIEAEK